MPSLRRSGASSCSGWRWRWAPQRELSGDRRAFQRWFGYDAVRERYHRQVSRFDRRLAFGLERLGTLAVLVLRDGAGQADPLQLWRRLELEPLLRPLFTFAGNVAVRTASFRCLSRALQALPADDRESSLSDTSLKYIYRTALERSQDTWLQCEALTLLESLSPDSLDRALTLRIEGAQAGDDLFVRRHAVRLLGRRLQAQPRLGRLLDVAAADPNPALRQAVAEVLPLAPAERVPAVLSLLLVNSGYSAYTGIIPAITDKDSEIFSDEFNHASIIDGCRLSKAQTLIFRHKDLNHLEGLLKKKTSKKRIIITDTVFSMEGAIAPVGELFHLCKRYDVLLYLDDAHGLGVIGNGKGALHHFNMKPDSSIVQMGTFSKAFGSFGAFVAGSSDVIE